MDGISARQGPHHVAHTFRKTTFPFRDAGSKAPPSRSVSFKRSASLSGEPPAGRGRRGSTGGFNALSPVVKDGRFARQSPATKTRTTEPAMARNTQVRKPTPNP